MAIFENYTRFSVDEFAGHDHKGRPFYTVLVKATYACSDQGKLVPAADQQPIVPADVYAGDPGASGPVVANDYAPFKPLVDVLLAGKFALRSPIEQMDVTLEVGRRLKKTVRVFGDRVWASGVVSTVSLLPPRPFTEMPLDWGRSFGGLDPEHPETFEPRNPVGRGLRKKPQSLKGQLAPNFEDPRALLSGWNSRPAPIGFGPVAPHWQPRVAYAGTFDQKWQDEVFPLMPDDFDERYFNCAPADQQLSGYAAGEEVSLRYAAEPPWRFALPSLDVPALFVLRRGEPVQQQFTPDTILIDPSQRCVTLVGRIKYLPRPDIASVIQVLVGKPTPGRQRALATGKRYIDLRRMP